MYSYSKEIYVYIIILIIFNESFDVVVLVIPHNNITVLSTDELAQKMGIIQYCNSIFFNETT